MKFDRDSAVEEWRLSLLSRGGLTVSELDELQDHLEFVEGDLSELLRPEEAFWLAAHRVGTPDALTREFAKVRPNREWEVRAQWALLGILAYTMLVPVASALVHFLAAVLANYTSLIGFAEVLRLNSMPTAITLVLVATVLLVRWSRSSPSAVERLLGRMAAAGWSGLTGTGLAVVAYQLAVNFLLMNAFAMTRGGFAVTGEPAPLQAEFWFWLAQGFSYLWPVILLVLIVLLQRRLDKRPANVPA